MSNGITHGVTKLTVSYCSFIDNKINATGGSGGAIWTNDVLSVSFCTFAGNSTLRGGGAIDYYIHNNGSTGFNASMTLTDDTFTSNSSESGGAVFSDVYVASGTVTESVFNDTFYNNSSVGPEADNKYIYGGGLDVYNTTAGTGSSSVTLVNDTFFQNRTSYKGGGLTVGITKIAGNTGTNTATLTSLTVYKNTASVAGGGLFVEFNSVSLGNSIMDGNSLPVGRKDITGQIIDLGFNLFGTSDAMYSNGKNDIVNDNTGLASTLAQNGAPAGYPKTLALSVTSVAYEQGDQNLTNRNAPWNKDERGFLRQNGKVSIGSEDPDGLS